MFGICALACRVNNIISSLDYCICSSRSVFLSICVYLPLPHAPYMHWMQKQRCKNREAGFASKLYNTIAIALMHKRKLDERRKLNADTKREQENKPIKYVWEKKSCKHSANAQNRPVKEKKSFHCFWRIHSIEHMCSMIFFSIQFVRYACTCIPCTMHTQWSPSNLLNAFFQRFMWTHSLCGRIISTYMDIYEQFRVPRICAHVLLFSANFLLLTNSLSHSVSHTIHSHIFFSAVHISIECEYGYSYILCICVDVWCVLHRPWFVFDGWARIRVDRLLLLLPSYLIFW